MRTGAFDFYAKPPVLSELKVIIGRAFHLATIEEQDFTHRAPAQPIRQAVGDGRRVPEMQAVFTTIRKVAASNAPILITGETAPGRNWWPAPSTKASCAGRGRSSRSTAARPREPAGKRAFRARKGAFTGATLPCREADLRPEGDPVPRRDRELPVNLQVNSCGSSRRDDPEGGWRRRLSSMPGRSVPRT